MSSRRPTSRGRTALGVPASGMVAIVLVLLAGLAVPPVSSAAGLCTAQRAALVRVQAAIDIHNAQPHLFQPGQEAALAAYNAEARQLNRDKQVALAAFTDCRGAEDILAGQSTAPDQFRIQMTASLQRSLTRATRSVPRRFLTSRWVPAAGGATVPGALKPIYERLRTASPRHPYPDVPLQGRPRPRFGDPDPAYPGATIGGTAAKPDVSPDHIYPLAAIIRLPGFLRLTPRNMYSVVNAPVNLQWLSKRANSAKRSVSMGRVLGVSPSFARQQVVLEQRARRQLERAIELLLRTQARGR